MIGINNSEILLHNPDPYIRLTGIPELRSAKVRVNLEHCISFHIVL